MNDLMVFQGYRLCQKEDQFRGQDNSRLSDLQAVVDNFTRIPFAKIVKPLKFRGFKTNRSH